MLLSFQCCAMSNFIHNIYNFFFTLTPTKRYWNGYSDINPFRQIIWWESNFVWNVAIYGPFLPLWQMNIYFCLYRELCVQLGEDGCYTGIVGVLMPCLCLAKWNNSLSVINSCSDYYLVSDRTNSHTQTHTHKHTGRHAKRLNTSILSRTWCQTQFSHKQVHTDTQAHHYQTLCHSCCAGRDRGIIW